MRTFPCLQCRRAACTVAFLLFGCVLGLFAIADLHAELSPSSDAEASPLETIQSSDVAKLLEMVGAQVIVEGVVQRIGKDDASGIHFLNFSESRGGFVVVIFPKSLPAFEGIDIQTAYRGQLVRVEGRLSLYEGQPQIILKTPTEIRVVDSGDE